MFTGWTTSYPVRLTTNSWFANIIRGFKPINAAIIAIDVIMENTITFNRELSEIEKRISKGLSINVVCGYCEGPIYGKPRILKFADIERFFCCISCKSGYNEKYRGRIESIKRKYEGKSDIDV